MPSNVMPAPWGGNVPQAMQFGAQQAVRAGEGVNVAAARLAQTMNFGAEMHWKDRWEKKRRDLARDQMKQQMVMQGAGLVANIGLSAIGLHQGYMNIAASQGTAKGLSELSKSIASVTQGAEGGAASAGAGAEAAEALGATGSFNPYEGLGNPFSW